MANKCDLPGKEDVTFATFTPKTGSGKLPVFLFAHTYGGNSVCHTPLLQALADKGYICVTADRTEDMVGSTKDFIRGALNGKTVCALSSDGTYLAACLDWIKKQETVNGFEPDLTKVVAGGFSMGGVEVVHFAGTHSAEIKAMILISPSTLKANEKLFHFRLAKLQEILAGIKIPSLYICSDKDGSKKICKLHYGAAPSPAAVLSFKDSHLDNSMSLTSETTMWKLSSWMVKFVIFVTGGGLRRHFALASERKVVSDVPIHAFISKHVLDSGDMPLAPPETVDEIVTK